MLGLKHYQFRQKLDWLAKKYGKAIISVNESYTSKTLSWTGEVKEIGGAKVIRDDKMRIMRDVNGARGIFLRALS